MAGSINMFNTRIIPIEISYHRARSLREALELLKKLGPEARVIAGGTDLLVQIKTRQVSVKHLIDIKWIREIRGIEEREGAVAIGAATRLQEILESPVIAGRIKALYEAVRSMASWQIRNMATVGGNLCNASPAADTAPPLMVFNAVLDIAGLPRGRRTSINSFFQGPKKTILRHGEILAWIMVPIPEGAYGSAFTKIARTSMDLAKASAAALVRVSRDGTVEEARVALGSVAPTPVRAPSVEEALVGRRLTEDVLRRASGLVENDIDPITDVRSTREYRLEVSKTLVFDTVMRAYRRAMEAASR